MVKEKKKDSCRCWTPVKYLWSVERDSWAVEWSQRGGSLVLTQD